MGVDELHRLFHADNIQILREGHPALLLKIAGKIGFGHIHKGGGILKGQAVILGVHTVQQLFVACGDLAGLVDGGGQGFSAKNRNHKLGDHGVGFCFKKKLSVGKLVPQIRQRLQNPVSVQKKRRNGLIYLCDRSADILIKQADIQQAVRVGFNGMYTAALAEYTLIRRKAVGRIIQHHFGAAFCTGNQFVLHMPVRNVVQVAIFPHPDALTAGIGALFKFSKHLVRPSHNVNKCPYQEKHLLFPIRFCGIIVT